ncbi:transposase family protein [Amycolatopsis mediterranei]|uniref:transposase family protein n=1 Tax=Amycolatopsis mediterranei TaxID=33910 RepID=UPI003448FAEA
MVQVITVSRPEWIAPFTGLQPAQFRKLVRLVAKRGGDEIADGPPRSAAAGRPGIAGRNVLADEPDGGYQGNPEVVMPYRKPRDGNDLPGWKEDLNATHRKVRARIEHVLSRMKNFKILRDYRRTASTLAHTVSGIANLHNILLNA